MAELDLRQAREQQQLARLEAEQALEVLARRRILSPIAGVVTSRDMSVGELADDGRILTLAQIDPLRVEVILPAAQFGSILPGLKAAVEPELAGQTHVASVRLVDPVIDPASGTFAVHLELPNPRHAIPAGVHCHIRFIGE